MIKLSLLKTAISFIMWLVGCILFATSQTETNRFSLNTVTWEVSAPSLSGGMVTGLGEVTMNTTTTLEAVPHFGYVFLGWTGDVNGTTNPISLFVDSDKSIGADFISTTNLFRVEQEYRFLGRAEVLADPASFNLISADTIELGLSLGGIRINGSGPQKDIAFTIETSTDLNTWVVQETISRQLQMPASGPLFIRVGVPD